VAASSDGVPESASSVRSRLAGLFRHYSTANLVGVSAAAFTSHIAGLLGRIDYQQEGYSQAGWERQRDLSVAFHWGHDHDFGSFNLQGRMKDRHLSLLADFVELFPISLDDLRAKSVLDVGCWTGGTTLALAALGCTVVAVEEVKKYAEAADYLARSFGLADRVTVRATSLYSCNRPEFHDRFDLAYVPGVIYHLSDPVVALRVLFNSLRIGGTILIESPGSMSPSPIAGFGEIARCSRTSFRDGRGSGRRPPLSGG
jgi:SAM-dependent methyltransferase